MNAAISAAVFAICWIHDARSHCSGRIARACFVSMRTFGVIKATDQAGGTGSGIASMGSIDRDSTRPPRVIGAMLSRWRPETNISPSSAAVMISSFVAGSPDASAAAYAPATLLAALPPIPPDTGNPLSMITTAERLRP